MISPRRRRPAVTLVTALPVRTSTPSHQVGPCRLTERLRNVLSTEGPASSRMMRAELGSKCRFPASDCREISRAHRPFHARRTAANDHKCRGAAPGRRPRARRARTRAARAGYECVLNRLEPRARAPFVVSEDARRAARNDQVVDAIRRRPDCRWRARVDGAQYRRGSLTFDCRRRIQRIGDAMSPGDSSHRHLVKQWLEHDDCDGRHVSTRACRKRAPHRAAETGR